MEFGKLRYVLTLIAACAALGLALTGCEIEDDADAQDATSNTGNDTGTTTTPGDTTTPTTPATLPYRYVRIDDLSTTADTINGGADIDAVYVDKGGTGTLVYADNVEAFLHGGGFAEGPDLDPLNATGAPDSFFAFPDTAECDADNGFVSLGGVGGYIILRMGSDDQIEVGDAVGVLEVGGCDFGGNNPAIIEEVEVSVSVANQPDSTWTSLGTGEGPLIEISVTSLPDVPAN